VRGDVCEGGLKKKGTEAARARAPSDARGVAMRTIGEMGGHDPDFNGKRISQPTQRTEKGAHGDILLARVLIGTHGTDRLKGTKKKRREMPRKRGGKVRVELNNQDRVGEKEGKGFRDPPKTCGPATIQRAKPKMKKKKGGAFRRCPINRRQRSKRN